MADTGFVRFTSVNDDGIWTNESNLVASQTGEATSNSQNYTAELTLSGLSLGIPSDATITGVEYQYRGRRQGGLGFGTSTSLKTFLKLSGTGDEEINQMDATFATYGDGGDGDLLGLTINPSNVNNLELVIKINNNAGSGTFHVDGSNSPESPAIKVYYSEPTPPPSATGENSLLINSGQLSLTSGQLFIR